LRVSNKLSVLILGASLLALVGAGVDVSGLEIGSDLESLFLSLTEGS